MSEENAIVTVNGESTELTAPASFEGLTFLNPSDMPNLEEAEVGVSIEPKYYEFKNEGDLIRAIFNGLTTITSNKNGEKVDVPAVVLQTAEGLYLNAGASLVQQMQKLRQGQPVQITYTGKEKTNSGYNVNKFDVRLLNVKGHVTPHPIQAPAPVTPKPAQQTDTALRITPAWVINNGYCTAKDEKGKIAEASNLLNLLCLVGKTVEYAEPKIIQYASWRAENLDPKDAAAKVLAGEFPF